MMSFLLTLLALFDSDISELETSLVFLPARMGGLGICDPIEWCDVDFCSSLARVTVVLLLLMVPLSLLGLNTLLVSMLLRFLIVKVLTLGMKKGYTCQFPEARQRTIKRAVGSGISHWLTTFPLERYHFDLVPIEFRDALALRYLRMTSGLPSWCDGCGESFTLQHGLDCPKGGLSSGGTMGLGTV